MPAHAFISYSRQDGAYVTRLVTKLREFGATVWLDDEIDYGSRWSRVIQEKIRSSAVVIVVMTPAAEKSDWVQREINEAERHEKPIFPLLLEGEDWFQLSTYQHEDVTNRRLPDERFLHAVLALAGLSDTPQLETGSTAPSPARHPVQESLQRNKLSHLRIFVAGSDSAGMLDPFAEDFGKAVAALDVGVVSLSGPAGIAAGYAMGDELKRLHAYDPDRIRFVYRAKARPTPGLAKRLGTVIHSDIEDKDQLRRELLRDCIAVVGIAGGDQTLRELEIAAEERTPIIPLGASGGAALAAWKHISLGEWVVEPNLMHGCAEFADLRQEATCVPAAVSLLNQIVDRT